MSGQMNDVITLLRSSWCNPWRPFSVDRTVLSSCSRADRRTALFTTTSKDWIWSYFECSSQVFFLFFSFSFFFFLFFLHQNSPDLPQSLWCFAQSYMVLLVTRIVTYSYVSYFYIVKSSQLYSECSFTESIPFFTHNSFEMFSDASSTFGIMYVAEKKASWNKLNSEKFSCPCLCVLSC